MLQNKEKTSNLKRIKVSLKNFLYLFFKKTMISFLALSMLIITLPINYIDEAEALDEDSISPLALTPETSDPKFTIQHYFYFDAVETSDEDLTIKIDPNDSTTNDDTASCKKFFDSIYHKWVDVCVPATIYIPFINSSGLAPNEVPANEDKGIKNSVLEPLTSINNRDELLDALMNPDLTYVKFKQVADSTDTDGEIYNRKEMVTEKSLIRLFEDEETHYTTKPQIQYMNRLYNSAASYSSYYTLKEIWVYQPDDDGTVKEDIDTLEDDDFIKYPLSEYDIDPSKVRFTNNPDNSHISAVVGKVAMPNMFPTDDYPYCYTILIQQDTVVRLVFDTTNGEHNSDVNFFDYDISDGYIYSDSFDPDAYLNLDPTIYLEYDPTVYFYVNSVYKPLDYSRLYRYPTTYQTKFQDDDSRVWMDMYTILV